MKSKRIYVAGSLLLILIVLFIYRYVDPGQVRIWQHRTYNTEVEDTSLSTEEAGFSSRLPVVSIDTGGQTIPGKPEDSEHVSDMLNSYVQATIRIMSREDQLNTLQAEPDVESDVQIRVRGNSSRFFDKVGYLFKFVNSKGEDKDYSVMGMEEDSTWVLHGPYLDKTLMRNYMWYNLSGQIMEWAPDVRYCEVFINHEYRGVYVMTEQISVGEGRVEVTKYNGRAPVSSYIVCADRASVNDEAYLDNFTEYTRRINGKIEVKYPGVTKLTDNILDYVSRDFSEFEKALYSFDYDSRRYGYETLIDVDSFVDYFIISEITQNSDAGLYSTYLYKDVTGKTKLAVWDFNNCCDNYVDDQMPMAGFFMQNRTWYFMLCKDENFVQEIIDRYKELRRGVLKEENIVNCIEEIQDYLGTAVTRNFQKWGYSFEPEYDLMMDDSRKISSYNVAIEQYSDRLIRRMRWMDDHIEELKSYGHESVNKRYNQ